MKIMITNKTGKQNWAADVITGEEFTHRVHVNHEGATQTVNLTQNGETIATLVNTPWTSNDEIVDWVKATIRDAATV